MSLLELQNITAGYDNNVILKDLNLQVEKRELMSLLGSNGCGKTTTLRLIAGLSDPMSGTLMFNGKDCTRMPLHKRSFDFVFQSYTLSPHMTIFDNVAFNLKMRKMSPERMKKEAMDMLETVDLTGSENRFPKEMSDGRKQRVALAGALVIKPDLLLLGEPLSNLDAKLRVKMRVEIRRLQQKLGSAAIYVTRDQGGCFAISDKVTVMNKGVIEQMDASPVIYNHPNTEFIAHFVGFENFIDLTKTEKADVCRTANGQSIRMMNGEAGERFKIYIRPEDIQVAPAGTSVVNGIPGEITVNTFLGRRDRCSVRTGIGELEVGTDQENIYRNGDKVTLSLAPNKVILL